MGSYLFANQYQNEVIPEDAKVFKHHWLKYYSSIPTNVNRFAFIDPAIGQRDEHDYTGISVIDVATDGTWYLRLATRERLTPTEIVSKMFELQNQFQLKGLGIEIVAYQEALMYMLDEEMRKRKVVIPVKGIRRNQISKQTRILGLVPRFEWARLLIAQGMRDFEDEYSTFPRGSHDDILDSIASLEELAYPPQEEKPKPLQRPHSPNHPDYERWVLQNYVKRENGGYGD